MFLNFALHCHLSPTAALAKSKARASWHVTGGHLPWAPLSAYFSTFEHPRIREMEDKSFSSYVISGIPPAKGRIVPCLLKHTAHFQKALLDLISPNADHK